MKKKALITGVTGQDGAIWRNSCSTRVTEVHGIKRRTSLFNTDRIDHLYQESARERPPVHSALRRHDRLKQPHPHRAAGCNRTRSTICRPEPRGGVVRKPEYTADSDALGALRLLEAVRILGLEQKARFLPGLDLRALGKATEVPQRETTPFYPRSPYGAAKLYAYWITVNYREAYGLYACNGILFNHESPVRGETFVTRKITRGLARRVSGSRTVFISGTWMRGATGAPRAISSRRSG